MGKMGVFLIINQAYFTWGQHCAAGTVSGTRGNAVEEGTAPHRETAAANTTAKRENDP